MAINWNFDPSQYSESSFTIIPAGDHRVRIIDVVEKTFNSGNPGFEITLEVSGYSSRLWYYLVIDTKDAQKTNQRLGGFFDSFSITNYNLAHYAAWKGKVGAVRVKHEEYNSEQQAKVAFCLSKANQTKLPSAQFKGGANVTTGATAGYVPVAVDEDELPF